MKKIFVSDSAADILRRRGVPLDELPTSLAARMVHAASAQRALSNGAYSLLDAEGLLGDDPPSGLAEANDRHRKLLADLNARNAAFWAKGGQS